MAEDQDAVKKSAAKSPKPVPNMPWANATLVRPGPPRSGGGLKGLRPKPPSENAAWKNPLTPVKVPLITPPKAFGVPLPKRETQPASVAGPAGPAPVPLRQPVSEGPQESGPRKRMLNFYSKRYKPVQLLGQGARGAVFKAEDRVLNILVAIKFLPDLLALNKDAVAQIKHEAALAMRLSHDNIVRLHNVEMESGRFFLVMEYVDGRNFRQILEHAGKLSLRSVLSVAESCAHALDYAHQRGILHRDLKPENLMLNQDSVLKIVDFGTAMMVRTKTASEFIEGTPGYMSPEELLYEPLDRRADVYSLGVVLSELLTGTPPFPFDTDLQKLVELEPAPMPDVPAPVAQVLLKAMAKKRTERWSSAGELYQALARAAESDRGHK
jgi:serine/threonine protein kinase